MEEGNTQHYYSKNEYGIDTYYQKLFPFNEIFELFKHPNREFCFQSESGIWRRYLNFNNACEFKSAIENHKPHAIHIGAVFERPFQKAVKNNNNMNNKSKNEQEKDNRVMGRELIFDVDITDYDNYRVCCEKGSGVCTNCWQFCSIAMKILNYVLKEVYGFEDIVYVFSGNKGFHAWVLDAKAFSLSAQEREEIVRFFKLDDKLWKSPNPIVKDIYNNICLQELPALLQKQKGLAEKLAAMQVSQKMEKNIARMIATMKLMWPKIDEKVTSGINHATKVPLCIHPKSGNVAWIINIGECPLDGMEKFVDTNKLQSQKQLLSKHAKRNLNTNIPLLQSPFITQLYNSK